jgi:DNA polymerase-3 subunit gamma/tau
MGDGHDSGPAPDPGDPGGQFVSLYRRFRPGRFDELRGQPHIVRALRSAVRDGRVAHAYLFSGPRGTGKTSTARILARALNCVSLEDGEPCGRCPSCVEIAKGSSLDVHELDAASNNGVDAMRDLVSHAALATPGRSKVYIVDEVHMLSTAAANALLKTLEEPPTHVVFVLATTDPQKVPATIRSRTQHFDFRLLTAQTLSDLLLDVRNRAGLALDDEAVAVAVRRGRGSARDALSALDLVAASGSADDVRPEIVGLLQAIADDDGEATLVLATSLHEAGWGPQQLASELVEELRETFLAALAPELAGSRGVDPDELAGRARALGLARLVRAIELVGKAQVDMRDAADARIVLEVALVRLARPDLDDSPSALLDRLARLERVASSVPSPAGSPASSRPVPAPAPGSAASPQASVPSPQASVPSPQGSAATPPNVEAASEPGSTGPGPGPVPEAAAMGETHTGSRPTIGALRRQQAAQPVPIQPDSAQQDPTDADSTTAAPDFAPPPAATPPPDFAPPAAQELAPQVQPAPAQPAPQVQPAAAASADPVSASGPPDRDTLVQAWGDHVLKSLTPKAKALFSAGRFVSVTDDLAVFALPSVPHRDKCEELRGTVEEALASRVGSRVRLQLVTEGASTGAAGRAGATGRGGPAGGTARDPRRSAAPDPGASGDPGIEDFEDADFDPDDPGEPVEIESVAEARLLEAFPGAQEVDD